ncbi:MAG: hypothetical protein Q8J69_08215 [Sphingobacteriaceae bacterium]|nr:hypothetical protein [Sphingobacteriaceae bacterium]
MEKRLLDAEEIAQVRQWIGARGFKYTDLQAEILDHVVCAMEAKLHIDPSLPLRTAFDQVHQSFGVFGFATIEDAMLAKIEKQVWTDLKASFRFFTSQSGLAALLLCLFAVYLLSHFSQQLAILLLPYWLLFFIGTIYRIHSYRQNKKLLNFLSFRTRIGHSILTFPLGFHLAANPWITGDKAEITLLWPAMLLCGFICLIELCNLHAFSIGIKRSVNQAERYLALS